MNKLGEILDTIERLPGRADALTRGNVADLQLVASRMRHAAARLETIALCHSEAVPEPRVVPFRRLRLVNGGRH